MFALAVVAVVANGLRLGPLRAGMVEEFAVSREIKSVRVFDGNFAEDICDLVAVTGSAAIAEKGSFSLAVPGGSVVKALEGLDEDAMDFSKMHVFFCNDNIESKKCYKGALAALDGLVPAENVHSIGDGTPEEVAASYEDLLRSHESLGHAGLLPQVDMVLLGTGDDGHVGSIYPFSDEVKQFGLGKVVLPIDKDGKKAVAVSLDFMCAARVALVSAAGKVRAPMVATALSGEYDDYDCPAALVEARDETIWFIDEAAATDFDDMDIEVRGDHDHDEDD